MYSIRCERCRAQAEKGRCRARWARSVNEEGHPLSLFLSPSRRRGYKRKGPVGAPRTRGERSGKEMRKSVINWRWDYSRRALRRQAARRTTWKVLPDTFRSLSPSHTRTHTHHAHTYRSFPPLTLPPLVSSGAMDGSLAGPVQLRSLYGPANTKSH